MYLLLFGRLKSGVLTKKVRIFQSIRVGFTVQILFSDLKMPLTGYLSYNFTWVIFSDRLVYVGESKKLLSSIVAFTKPITF